MQQSVHPMAWFENGWSKHDDDNDPKYSNKLFNSFHLIHTQKYSQQLHCFILFRYFSTALSTGLSKQFNKTSWKQENHHSKEQYYNWKRQEHKNTYKQYRKHKNRIISWTLIKVKWSAWWNWQGLNSFPNKPIPAVTDCTFYCTQGSRENFLWAMKEQYGCIMPNGCTTQKETGAIMHSVALTSVDFLNDI